LDGVETPEYYSGSGSIFGYGTNEITRTSGVELVKRLKIVDFLTAKRGRKHNAISLGHIKNVGNDTFSLTDDGWDYWKDIKLN